MNKFHLTENERSKFRSFAHIRQTFESPKDVKIFDFFDIDNNKKIDYCELKKTWELFEKLDLNRDSILSKKELSYLTQRCNFFKKDGINSDDLMNFIDQLSEKLELCSFEKVGEIISILNDDVTKKNFLFFPTTGKDILEHVQNFITPENITQVLSRYKINFDETFLDAVDSEWGLDDSIKEKIKNHLLECYIASDVWNDKKPNCKFDQNMYQGYIGDCWLLATIGAFAANDKGKDILNDIITDNNDGTYTVSFKGTDKKINVSLLEIMNKSDYSSGDLDVRILELAAEKYFNILGIAHGGYTASAMNLLLGEDAKRNDPENYSIDELRRIIKDENNVTAAHTLFRTGTGINQYGSEQEIYHFHAYAVVDMDDKYVYLKNPHSIHDLDERQDDDNLRVPIEEFQRCFSDISYVRLA